MAKYEVDSEYVKQNTRSFNVLNLGDKFQFGAVSNHICTKLDKETYSYLASYLAAPADEEVMVGHISSPHVEVIWRPEIPPDTPFEKKAKKTQAGILSNLTATELGYLELGLLNLYRFEENKAHRDAVFALFKRLIDTKGVDE